MGLQEAANEVDRAIGDGDPRGLGYENVFSGVPSFLRRKLTRDLTGFDLAVTGIPFDQAVTHRPGARFGPRAIREASTLMAGDVPYGWGYSPLEQFAVADAGDMAFDYANPAGVPDRIEAHVGAILDAGAGCILLGGDHSVTLPALRAHAARRGPLALVQFDAHPDTWSDDERTRVDHGTIIYKAVREGLIDPARSIQIGTRVAVENEVAFGLSRLDAPAIHARGTDHAVHEIKRICGDAQVYLTFDIDALDPAFAPGTGTPVWGGLTTAQAGAILRGLAGLALAGGDVVEVAPAYDSAQITAFAGAHVAYELIALWGWTRRK